FGCTREQDQGEFRRQACRLRRCDQSLVRQGPPLRPASRLGNGSWLEHCRHAICEGGTDGLLRRRERVDGAPRTWLLPGCRTRWCRAGGPTSPCGGRTRARVSGGGGRRVASPSSCLWSSASSSPRSC